jgi:hypothetical protein
MPREQELGHGHHRHCASVQRCSGPPDRAKPGVLGKGGVPAKTEAGRSKQVQLQVGEGADTTMTPGMEKLSLGRQLQALAGQCNVEQRARWSGIGVGPR